VWTPAQKVREAIPSDQKPPLNPLSQLADWLESYSKIMELNVWTSSTVTSAEKDASGAWVVHLTRILPDGTEIERVLRPVHLVTAQGLGAGSWSVPKFPKQVLFFHLSSRSGSWG